MRSRTGLEIRAQCMKMEVAGTRIETAPDLHGRHCLLVWSSRLRQISLDRGTARTRCLWCSRSSNCARSQFIQDNTVRRHFRFLKHSLSEEYPRSHTYVHKALDHAAGKDVHTHVSILLAKSIACVAQRTVRWSKENLEISTPGCRQIEVEKCVRQYARQLLWWVGRIQLWQHHQRTFLQKL